MITQMVSVEEFNAIGESITKERGLKSPLPSINQRVSIQLFAHCIGDDKARVAAFAREKTGYLGWYASSENSGLSTSVLNAACDWLKANGCTTAHGPINGSTWGDYRFNLDSETPLFPGEPVQPIYFIAQWENAGFQKDLTYETTIVHDLPKEPLTLHFVNQHLDQFGARADYFPQEIGEELSKQLYDFYHLCFQYNPLFEAISFERYKAITEKASTILDYDCSYLLEDSESNPIGVFLAYRDVYAHLREDEESILFLKTIAVHPDWQNKFIGQMMIGLTLLQSKEVGYDQSVFSMMFSKNLSAIKGKSNFGSTVLRKYALYTKQL